MRVEGVGRDKLAREGGRGEMRKESREREGKRSYLQLCERAATHAKVARVHEQLQSFHRDAQLQFCAPLLSLQELVMRERRLLRGGLGY